MVSDLEALSKALTGAAAAHDKMMVNGLVDTIKANRDKIEQDINDHGWSLVGFRGMQFKVSKSLTP